MNAGALHTGSPPKLTNSADSARVKRRKAVGAFASNSAVSVAMISSSVAAWMPFGIELSSTSTIENTLGVTAFASVSKRSTR